MARRFSPSLVGAFVLAAVILGTAASVYLGSARIFQHKVSFVVVFAQDLQGLDVDAPVKFRGVAVGRVASIHLSMGSPKDPLRELYMPVVIELYQSRLREMGERTDFGDPQIVRTLIEHGLRARLAIESLLSGRRYVDLDIVPSAPPAPPPPMSFPYEVIPVYVEPGLASLQADATKVLAKLQALDLEGLLVDLRSAAGNVGRAATTIDRAAATLGRAGEALPATLREMDEALAAIRELARTLDAQVPPVAADARAALERLAGSLESVDRAVQEVKRSFDPGAPIPVRLEEALREMTQTARSIRLLVDSIERNPSELVRGRYQVKP
ncbi:MAG TPA: MlaD family protein [Anaeromyxobacteraceae bacterium]|nr:MlaD family protein [Anaeromyxobacteraceae bacterium]